MTRQECLREMQRLREVAERLPTDSLERWRLSLRHLKVKRLLAALTAERQARRSP